MSGQEEIGRDARLLEELQQRQRLYERLEAIQRSISHHAPLREVLDAITTGARDLLGDKVVGLRLIDEDDPSYYVLVSACGIPPPLWDRLRRMRLSVGIGGVAIRENRIVVEHDYGAAEAAMRPLADAGLRAAMGAPVHEGEGVVGSLVVASYSADRIYTSSEQDALLAFARHASLALSDAKAIEAMREAQRSKEMFSAEVSHALKTPLTAIIGLLLTLKKHNAALPDELRNELISDSYDRAKDLRKLIDLLLAGAKAELAGSDEEVFLPALVADAAKGFDRSRNVLLSGIPKVTLLVDAAAVRDILGILLENATSHSAEESEIVIEGRLRPQLVSLSVRNEGELPEETDPSLLFAAFKRGMQRTSSTGVGLGLHIASRLARSISGDLEARSGDGNVSFTLNFPFRLPPQGHNGAA